MGPAAGISFAVLRINRATLRLDPRVGPPSSVSPPPFLLSPSASRLPRSTFPSTFSYPLLSLYRASNTDVRDSSLLHRLVVDVVVVVLFVFAVVMVVDVTRTSSSSSSNTRTTFSLFVRNSRDTASSSSKLISIYLGESAGSTLFFLFLFFFSSLLPRPTRARVKNVRGRKNE